jgi:hypothetical protein
MLLIFRWPSADSWQQMNLRELHNRHLEILLRGYTAQQVGLTDQITVTDEVKQTISSKHRTLSKLNFRHS